MTEEFNKIFMNQSCNNNNCKFNHDINACNCYYFNNNCLDNNCKKIHYKNYILKKNTKSLKNNKNYRKNKNTVDFKPLQRECDMKIVLELSESQLTKDMTANTVFLAPNIFKEYNNKTLYR